MQSNSVCLGRGWGEVGNEAIYLVYGIFCNLQEWRHNHKQGQLSPDQAAPKQVCSLKCVISTASYLVLGSSSIVMPVHYSGHVPIAPAILSTPRYQYPCPCQQFPVCCLASGL